MVEDFISKVEELIEDNEYWGDVDSFDLEKPFALPLIEKPDNDNWRFPVDFDKWSTEYWFSQSTALFFGQLKFPKNEDITIQVFPSMGAPFSLGVGVGMSTIESGPWNLEK